MGAVLAGHDVGGRDRVVRGIGLVVVPAERQRRAVAAIEALGGSVEYVEPDQEASEAFPRPFLRRWLPRDYFDEVRESLSRWHSSHGRWAGAPARADGAARLLYLDGTQVTDAGLAHLQGLTGLQVL